MSRLLRFDADYCLRMMPDGSWDSAWDPGRWVPADPELELSLYVDDDGIVQRIDVTDRDLSTPEGIALRRSGVSDILAAYPEARIGEPGAGTVMLIHETAEGALGFEVGNDEQYRKDDNDRLVTMQVTAPGYEPRAWAYSDASAGGCL